MSLNDAIRTALAEALALLEAHGPQTACSGDRVGLDSIGDGRLNELADEVLRCMSRVIDEISVDRYGLPQKSALPPTRFFEVHDILFRFRNKSYKELARELERQ